MVHSRLKQGSALVQNSQKKTDIASKSDSNMSATGNNESCRWKASSLQKIQLPSTVCARAPRLANTGSWPQSPFSQATKRPKGDEGVPYPIAAMDLKASCAGQQGEEQTGRFD